MKLFRLLSFLCIAVTFTACTSVESTQPVINFIGVSTGTLATELDNLNFMEVLPVDEHEILGVVSFDQVAAGTLVQSTWFSPDDRNMPLGRNTITVESGAKIVRFSIATQEDWRAAPFMLDIRARYPDEENPKTASGQVHFFFGMEEDAIQAYKDDYGAWQAAQQEKRRLYDIKRKHEEASLTRAKELLEEEEAGIGFRFDITGNGSEEILVVHPYDENAFPGAGGHTESGAVYTVQAEKLAVMDLSGSTVLLLNADSENTKSILHAGAVLSTLQTSETVDVHLFPSKLEFDWIWKGEQCKATVRQDNGIFAESNRECSLVPTE